MSTNTEDLNKELIFGILKDSADNFFGRRSRLETEIEFIKNKIEELKLKAKQIEDVKNIIQLMVITQENWMKFSDILGVDLGSFNVEIKKISACPFSLFLKSKYKKCFFYYYNVLFKKIEIYKYGEEIYDKEEKIKKISFNYYLLIKIIKQINKKIDEINTYYSPSKFLQFSKEISSSITSLDKSNVTGSMFVYDIDNDFKFNKLSLSEFELKEYPDIPSLNKKLVKKINSLLNIIYRDHRKKIQSLFK